MVLGFLLEVKLLREFGVAVPGFFVGSEAVTRVRSRGPWIFFVGSEAITGVRSRGPKP